MRSAWRWVRRAIIVTSSAAVMVWTLWRLPQEPDRWRAAAAVNDYLRGDREEARQQLASVADRLPDDVAIHMRLIRWLVRGGEGEEALWRLNQLVQRFGPREEFLLARCDAYLALGRFDEALNTFESLPAVCQVTARQPSIANNHAYLRGLAGRQLRQALMDIDNVLNAYERHFLAYTDLTVPPRTQAFLMACIVLRSVHRPAEAIRWINAEIHGLYAEYEAAKAQTQQRPFALLDIQEWLPFGGEWIDESPARSIEPIIDSLAALLTWRALLYQDLGMIEASVLDRRRVEWLQHDPEEILSRLPMAGQAMSEALQLAMLLDTRGVVLGRLHQTQNALADLEAAEVAAQSLLAVPWQARVAATEMETDAQLLQARYEEEPRRLLATILYHQLGLHRTLHDQQRISAILQQIEGLGFQPNSNLH